jgi:hypothetical protein
MVTNEILISINDIKIKIKKNILPLIWIYYIIIIIIISSPIQIKVLEKKTQRNKKTFTKIFNTPKKNQKKNKLN